MKTNIIMMGMPGSGKSTLGMALAKKLGKDFQDVDRVIEKREGLLLQQIIDQKGNDFFKQAEENAMLSLDVENTVLAPGGSAVYSDKGMKHLKENGIVIYLKINAEEMKSRIDNLETRGIVFKPGETLEDMFNYREPFYEKYADIIVDGDNIGVEENLKRIEEALEAFEAGEVL